MSKQTKADLWLVLVTAFWGMSYYLIDLCLEEMEPLNLNAIRFLVASSMLCIIFWKPVSHASKATLKYSLLIGLSLVCVYIGCTYGVMYTSLSNASFICALTVVFTPIFEFIFLHKKPGKKLFAAIILCTVGLALLTLNEQLRPAKGDIICLLCGSSYAVDLMITDKAVSDPTVDPKALSVLELGVVGIIMLVLSLLFETPHLPQTPTTWFSALFLAIFSSGLAFLIQTVQQKYTTPSHVGLIFTLEPVFSSIVAFFFAHEVLRPRGYLGAFLMLLSLFVMEIQWKKKQ